MNTADTTIRVLLFAIVVLATPAVLAGEGEAGTAANQSTSFRDEICSLEFGISIPTKDDEYNVPLAVLQAYALGWMKLTDWASIGLGIDSATAGSETLYWLKGDILLELRWLSRAGNGVALRASAGLSHARWEHEVHGGLTSWHLPVLGVAVLGKLGTSWGHVVTGPQFLLHGPFDGAEMVFSTLQWMLGFELVVWPQPAEVHPKHE